MKTEVCTKCNRRLPKDQYHHDSSKRTGRYPSCKGCQRLERGQVKRPKKSFSRLDVIYRRCNACKKYLKLEKFYTNTSVKDGLHTQCKMCSIKNATSEAAKIGQKGRRQAERMVVLNAYGNKCTCCGETRNQFLSIDHVNGGGNKHRKEIGHGHVYSWIRRNGFPPDFQILCHNCNLAKGFYGKCPHKEDSTQINYPWLKEDTKESYPHVFHTPHLSEIAYPWLKTTTEVS